MAKTLAQIEKQIQALQREAEAIKASEKSGVVARIKEAVLHYGITAAELGLSVGGATGTRKARGPYKLRKAGKSAEKKSPVAKYRDDAGHSWSGRGPKPKWFKAALEAGKKLEDLKA